MLSLPLFAATLLLAPTGATSLVELSAGVDFNSASVVSPILGGDGTMLGGSAGAGLTLFGHRVVDDDAPLSLQPYLQYAATFHVDGGGGGFRFSRDAGSTLPGNDSTNGYADVSASGYLDRTIYGALSFGVRDRSDSVNNLTTLSLPLTLSGGVRFGDVRLAIGWGIAPTRYGDDVFKVPFWGGAYAQVYAVVHRRLSLDATVAVIDGGASASGGAWIYLMRRFSVGVSVHGSHGHNGDLGFTSDHAGADVGFTAWTGPRFAIAIDYSFDWGHWSYANGTSEDDYTSVIDLSFRLRPR
jgi:hypothetical protein